MYDPMHSVDFIYIFHTIMNSVSHKGINWKYPDRSFMSFISDSDIQFDFQPRPMSKYGLFYFRLLHKVSLCRYILSDNILKHKSIKANYASRMQKATYCFILHEGAAPNRRTPQISSTSNDVFTRYIHPSDKMLAELDMWYVTTFSEHVFNLL